jgi:hypothetical protein
MPTHSRLPTHSPTHPTTQCLTGVYGQGLQAGLWQGQQLPPTLVGYKMGIQNMPVVHAADFYCSSQAFIGVAHACHSWSSTGDARLAPNPA